MKTKNNLPISKSILYFIFLMLPFFAFANDDIFEEDAIDTVPIDDYVFLVMLLGIFLVFRLLKIRNQIKNNI